MIKKNSLYEITGSNLIAIEMEKNKFDDLLNIYRFDKNKRNVVILLRGAKMKTVEDLFREFSSAFQFPSYFGENWSALDECINDLDWLPGDNYIVGINDIQDLLINEKEEELDILFKILNKTCLEWGISKDVGKEWGREGKPFHFLLQYAKKDLGLVRDRFFNRFDLFCENIKDIKSQF